MRKMKELPKKDTKRLDFKSSQRDIKVCIRSMDDKYIFCKFDNWVHLKAACHIGFMGDGTLQILVDQRADDIVGSRDGYLTVE